MTTFEMLIVMALSVGAGAGLGHLVCLVWKVLASRRRPRPLCRTCTVELSRSNPDCPNPWHAAYAGLK